MRFGCCVSTPEQIGVLAEAGYDFCELPAAAVRPFEDDVAALPTLRSLAAAPLQAESFNVLVPPQLPLVGPLVDREALRSYLRRAFGRMAQLGGAVAVLGSGGARRIPDGMPRDLALDQLAESIALAADEAGRAGIELALEPLNRNECNVFATLSECRAFVRDRALDQVRLLADLYHIEIEREPLDEVVAAGPLLVHVHVAGGGRGAPDIPGYDYDGFMAALATAGYDRRISAECAWDDLAAQAPGALAAMRERWEQHARKQ